MKFYETTYIVHSGIQDGRLDDIVKKVEAKVKSIDGNILFSDNWGRKKLAYYINKQKYGTYLFFQFKMSGNEKLPELIQELELNPDVLRHLIIQINEDNIKKNVTEDEKPSTDRPKKEAVKEESKSEEVKTPEAEISEKSDKVSIDAKEKSNKDEAQENEKNTTEEDKDEANETSAEKEEE